MAIAILDKAGCIKAIKSLRRNAAAVQARIHQVAVSALVHARDHGDTTIATNLLDALPRGQRLEGLAYWFSHFSNGKLAVSQGEDGWSHNKSAFKSRTETDFNVEGAEATTYAELTKEKKPGQTFTVDALVKKLKQLANEEGKFDDGSPKVEEAARDMAAKLLASIEVVPPTLKIAA